MLEYCKLILTKFSFSRNLFLKEYKKSIKVLSKNDTNELRHWARSTFGVDAAKSVKV
ncbi:hypothetical protein SAMN05660236_4062 [Ohtaekwangia koreensis]|uniref:Uncharacterized protein n=1 Tax=Ohtaekwangia koreensis TaxID=688867 RepID=A0A1T5M1F3_9BACT|nr:hypothetical protein SAMN05660236_4062 [Ohtaekwangia koreensis]